MRLTLTQKLIALLALFIAAAVTVVLLQQHGAGRVADGLERMDKVTFPALSASINLKKSFERIARGYEDAAVTGEAAFLQISSSEQRGFIDNMNQLQQLLGSEWESAYAELYVAFSKFTVQADRLAKALMVDRAQRQLTDAEIEELGRQVQRQKLKIFLQLDARLKRAKEGVSHELDGHSDYVLTMANRALLVAFGSGIALLFLAAIFFYQIIVPVRKLINMTVQVASGRLESSVHVEVNSADELGVLTRSFADMTNRLRRTMVSKEFVDQILQSQADILMLVTETGSVERVNQAFTDALGFTEGEILDRPVDRSLAQDDWNVIYNEVVRQSHRLVGVEASFTDSAGMAVPMSMSANMVTVGEGHRPLVVIVARDIREQLRRRDELEQARTLAEDAVTARGQFLARLSADLRLPIGDVCARMDLLAQTDLSEEQARLLNQIHCSTQDLRGFIYDLVDYAQLQSEGLDIVNVDFHLPHLIEQVVRRHVRLGMSSGVGINLNIEPELYGVLHGCPGRVEQIIDHLVQTAWADSGAKSVDIACRQIGGSGDGPLVRCIIQAHDGHLSEEVLRLASLGRPEQLAADDQRFRVVLRLVICQQIIEMMGGHLKIAQSHEDGISWVITIQLVAGSRPDSGLMAELAGRRCLLLRGADAPDEHLHHYLDRLHMSVIELHDLDGLRRHLASGDDEAIDVAMVDARLLLARPDEAEQLMADAKSAWQVPAVLLGLDAARDQASIAKRFSCVANLGQPVGMRQLRDCLRLVLTDWSENQGSTRQSLITSHLLAAMDGDTAMRVCLVQANLIHQTVYGRALEGSGFEIAIHDTLAEFLGSTGEETAAPDILVIDENAMDGGVEVLQRAVEGSSLGSGVKGVVVLADAFATEGMAELPGHWRRLAKPCSRSDLIDSIQSLRDSA